MAATRTKKIEAVPDPEPQPEAEAPKPEPLTRTSGEQLVFEGLAVDDRKVELVGPVTLTGQTLDNLALGQVVELRVTALVKSVSGKQHRDDWGDDRAQVRWQLYAEEAVEA